MPRSGSSNNGAPRPPASTDVARLAGVSQKTVSRVMNDEALVSDEMRRRVLEAARELGYRPNTAARALTSGRTFRIGFVSLGTALHGPISTLVAAEQAARHKGYSMAITTTQAGDSRGVAGAIDLALQQGAEAIVLSEPIEEGGLDINLDVPVLIFGHLPGIHARHVISILNAGDRSAEMATEYLLSLGHETVHHIAGPPKWYPSRERLEGWRRALEAKGAPVPEHIAGEWTAASGYDAAVQLAQRDDVTAVFCANDDMALGAIKGFADHGRVAPDDISIMGFDDIPTAAFARPALTTIRHPFESGAARGIEALITAIERPDDPTPAVTEPDGELIVRDSTAPRQPRSEGTPASGGGRRP